MTWRVHLGCDRMRGSAPEKGGTHEFDDIDAATLFVIDRLRRQPALDFSVEGRLGRPTPADILEHFAAIMSKGQLAVVYRARFYDPTAAGIVSPDRRFTLERIAEQGGHFGEIVPGTAKAVPREVLDPKDSGAKL